LSSVLDAVLKDISREKRRERNTKELQILFSTMLLSTTTIA
jgi:hypothetical protein